MSLWKFSEKKIFRDFQFEEPEGKSGSKDFFIMESFGARLRQAREAREIDLERASLETNITVEYLDALEKELIASFPCDTYLIGFLKNYAEYLNLDPDELVAMYKAIKTQIEPAPLELLLEPKKEVPVYAIAGSIIGVIIISLAVFLIVRLNASKDETREKVIAEAPPHSVYQLENVPIQKRVYQEDKIEVALDEDVVTITVADTVGMLTLDTPYGSQVVELGEEVEIDLDGQPGGEISVFLSDISKTDAKRGAEIQLVRIMDEEEMVVAAPVVEDETEEFAGTELVAETTAAGIDRTVILDSPNAYPVTLNANFRGQCLFRYQIDRKDVVEDFYNSSQTVSINANNGFRLWISNANAVKMQVLGAGHVVDLEVGRPGQVLVEDIKWVKDDDGRFKLVVMKVE